MAQLIDQLIAATPATQASLLEQAETIEGKHYDGDVGYLWAASHPSFNGYRVVTLRCDDGDGDAWDLLFFDHEDGETFTFIITQFDADDR